ncbi:hypothetical protein DSUL_20358 [Desulfovibrionales bacterium]
MFLMNFSTKDQSMPYRFQCLADSHNALQADSAIWIGCYQI